MGIVVSNSASCDIVLIILVSSAENWVQNNMQGESRVTVSRQRKIV